MPDSDFRILVINPGSTSTKLAVFEGVRERMPTVSLDTVYRTLWWLKDLGLITTLGSSRERTRFDANLSRHHHFVCVQCGLTRDFSQFCCSANRLPTACTARLATTN